METCCTTRVSVYDLSCCIRRHEASSASSHVNPPSIRSLSQTTSHIPTTLRYSSRVGRTVSLLSFSLSLRRKVATDYMFQIIEAHPNWLVYADVLERPPPRLASRRSIWSDVTPVDTNYAVERTGRLLWSPTLLLPTLLSDSQVSISLVIYGLW